MSAFDSEQTLNATGGSPNREEVAGIIEFFGGLLLAAGIATRLMAALVFGLMAVAVVQVHLPAGFFWTDGGYEYPLLWGILALSYVIRGGGRYSVDDLIGAKI